MARRRKRTSKAIPAKGRLREIADKLWSLAVRSDWGGKCAVCGRRKCESHHLIPRQYQATRYDLRNGIALCARCHQFDNDLSPHQNAAGWLLWLAKHHPKLHCWYTETVESGNHWRFEGTTNAAYYCDAIRGLKKYVDEDDFKRICGIKFSQYLQSEI